MLTKIALEHSRVGRHNPVAVRRFRADTDRLDGVTASVWFPDRERFPLRVLVEIHPTNGFWKGGVFLFRIEATNAYPFEHPEIKYIGPMRIWHPNIACDPSKKEWGVCLDQQVSWNPTLGLREIILSLELLFPEPCATDSLPGGPRKAAEDLLNSPDFFWRQVREWMEGNYLWDPYPANEGEKAKK